MPSLVAPTGKRSRRGAPARRRLRPVLDDLPTLDPLPVRWLQLTMQGIGFTDEVDRTAG